jgi:hypothetical protein
MKSTAVGFEDDLSMIRLLIYVLLYWGDCSLGAGLVLASVNEMMEAGRR